MTQFYRELTQDDLDTFKKNLAKKGIEIAFMQGGNFIIAEKMETEFKIKRRVKLRLHDYVLAEVQGDSIVTEISTKNIDLVEDIAIEYYKLMSKKFGEEYKENLYFVLKNNIENLSKDNYNTMTYKKNDLRLEKRQTNLNYFTDLQTAIFGKYQKQMEDMANEK